MKTRFATARTGEELAGVLGLSAVEAQEWQIQYSLLQRLRKIVREEGLTHADVAQRAGTSRTRVTSIINGNLDNVSTDLLIRLLTALGYRVRISVSRISPAA